MPTTRTRKVRPALTGLVLIALGALLALLPASAALAHARVESSMPKAGETLAEAPAEVTLVFTETITSQADQVRLLNSSGQEVPARVDFATDADAQGKSVSRVTITPQEPLAAGAWVASWSAVSADGHIVSGLVDFSIAGVPPSTGAAASSGAETAHAHLGHTAQDNRNRAGELPARVLEGMAWLAGIAGGMLLAGSLARRWVGVLAGIGVAAAGVYAFSIAAPLGEAALALRVGEVRAALAVLVAGVLAVTANALHDLTARRVAGGVSVGVFALQGLWSGHHLLTGLWPITLAHVAHLAAAAAWVGAVLALAAERTVEQGARTRTQATWAVLVLIPAAIVTSVWTSGIASADFSWGGWAVVLAVKLAAVLAALAAGLLNHRALSPARIDSTMSEPGRLRRFLQIEMAAIAATVVASAILTLYTPPSARAVPPAETSTAAEEGASAQGCTSPGLSWPESFNLTLAEGKRETVAVVPDASDVLLTLTVPSGSDPAAGAATLIATHTSGAEATIYLEPQQGSFSGRARLPLAGHWMLDAQIPVDAFTISAGTGHVDITPAPCATEAGSNP